MACGIKIFFWRKKSSFRICFSFRCVMLEILFIVAHTASSICVTASIVLLNSTATSIVLCSSLKTWFRKLTHFAHTTEQLFGGTSDIQLELDWVLSVAFPSYFPPKSYILYQIWFKIFHIPLPLLMFEWSYFQNQKLELLHDRWSHFGAYYMYSHMCVHIIYVHNIYVHTYPCV